MTVKIRPISKAREEVTPASPTAGSTTKLAEKLIPKPIAIFIHASSMDCALVCILLFLGWVIDLDLAARLGGALRIALDEDENVLVGLS